MRSNNAIIKKCVVQRFGVRTPELTQFVSKSPQDGSKMAPRWLQDGSRRPQGGHKSPKMGPSRLPAGQWGRKMGPAGDQIGPRGVKIEAKNSLNGVSEKA